MKTDKQFKCSDTDKVLLNRLSSGSALNVQVPLIREKPGPLACTVPRLKTGQYNCNKMCHTKAIHPFSLSLEKIQAEYPPTALLGVETS